ncbi:SprT-like domain-containing protein [Bradyrhizobium sp. Arg68]|uniref:SprT-like domain-containing protein n=1 Tax=Bradyrhizobium ivorense TaxID=2511166 RepID=UPI001E5A165A|nr:SprT-like domain-containing protein [Bradyrhizobium ivorense]MCC8942823.1 SprT-like domain-containing protein [Bradyrhizobium ivorense]
MTNPTVQAYAELQAAFDHYNARLFDGQLPFCLITMQREARTYGYFSSQRFVHRHDKSTTDEIAINPAYFAVVPLLEVLQTLVHEMAHAWQFHFGKPGRRGYHNKEWADKMEAIGLMPSNTGKPGGARTGEKMADYAITGGRFMQATDELLTRKFSVSWLDRFPPAHHVDGTPAAVNEDGDELGELVEAGTRNRSNRVKYRCPICSTQVWGKPELRILCGGDDCDAAEFEAVG